MTRLRIKILDRGSDGFIVRAYLGRRAVGHVTVLRTLRFFDVDKSHVNELERKHGIGLAMYEAAHAEACRRGLPLRSQGYQRSHAATGVWKHMERDGLARVSAVNTSPGAGYFTGREDFVADCEPRSNPDERDRSLERSWRAGDRQAGKELFWSIVRSRGWNPHSRPGLFWSMLGEPEIVQAMADLARGRGQRAEFWERDPASYVFLRAFRMGYMGKVEAQGFGHTDKFHVAARRFGVSAQENYDMGFAREPADVAGLVRQGAVPLVGSDPPAVLVSLRGLNVKKYAGKILKGRQAGRVLIPDNWEGARIMTGDPRQRGIKWVAGEDGKLKKVPVTRIYWKNPDEHTRRLERAAAAGDPDAQEAFRRHKERTFPDPEWIEMEKGDTFVTLRPLTGGVIVYGGPGVNYKIPEGTLVSNPSTGRLGDIQFDWVDAEGKPQRSTVEGTNSRFPYDVGVFHTWSLKRVGPEEAQQARRIYAEAQERQYAWARARMCSKGKWSGPCRRHDCPACNLRMKDARDRKKRRNPDERMRDLERRAAAGDAEAEAGLLRDRLRARTISLDNLRLAALLGHVPAQLAIDYVPPDPPYIQPDQVMIQVAQENEWGHRAAALWAYACVKGTEWVWAEVNGGTRFPSISLAPTNALKLIEQFLGAGAPCPEARTHPRRLQVYGFRERLEDVAHDLNEISFNEQDHGCACQVPDVATCGNCRRSWCDRCDPTPAALCPFCHGRGSSNAEIGATAPDRYLMAEGAANWIEGLASALSLWSEGENMHSHSRTSLWGNRHTIGTLWEGAPGSLGTHMVSVPLYARLAREAYRQVVWAVDLYRGGTGSNPGPVLDKAQLDVDRWTRAIILPELLA